jgi:heparinase II/III-like protein
MSSLAAPLGPSFAGAYFPVPDPEETRPEKIEAIMLDRFELNGETHHLPAPIDWTRNPSDDREWHILLHKFYYGVGLGMAFARSGERRYAQKWVELVESWIERTPVGFIAPDVTGRRVQNWIYAYHYFALQGREPGFDPAFRLRLFGSIHDQIEFLCENLAPARNHRTLELYTIFLAGVAFPEMPRAARWREFALTLILDNMRRDLLPDGVQCELSTDYHHLVLKSYLNVRRLADLNGIDVPREMDEHLLRALQFSVHAHKPDGIVPSLSDGDACSFRDLLLQGHEIYRRPEMLYVATGGARGTPPARRSVLFPDAGYAILRSGWGSAAEPNWGGTAEPFSDAHYMILDCGPLGAGNHGHFDCLSFELAAFGRSLVVDPGRYTYSEAGETNWRVAFRSTAYHNTVTVDGRNQTRYLPGVRKKNSCDPLGTLRHKVAGPAPDATVEAFVTERDVDYVHAIARSHEYDTVHERRVLFVRSDYWIVSDALQSECPHRYDLRFNLGEQALERVCERHDSDTLRYLAPNLLVAQPADRCTESRIEGGFVSYRYGEKLDAPVLRFTRHGEAAAFHTVLVPFRDVAPQVSVCEAPPVPGAHAFMVTLERAGARHVDHVLFPLTREELDWPLAGVRFRGRFLFLRRSEEGEVLRLHHDGIACID